MEEGSVTDEQWKVLVDFARLYVKARIDLQLLSGMLMRAEIDQVPPKDWLADLKRLRDLPAHRASLEELESLVKELEQTQRENELIHFLAMVPESDLLQ
jgi:hypothetical protein